MLPRGRIRRACQFDFSLAGHFPGIRAAAAPGGSFHRPAGHLQKEAFFWVGEGRQGMSLYMTVAGRFGRSRAQEDRGVTH